MRVDTAELPEPQATIPALLERWRLRRPGIAPRMGSFEATDIIDRVDRIGGALLERSRGSGRPVIAYPTPPGIDGALLFLAAASIGVAAPLRPGLTPSEESAAIELIAPDLYLGDGPDLVGSLLDGGSRISDGVDLRRSASASDLALVLTTSGTTGVPKRVGLDHHRLVSSAQNIAGWFALSPTDHALTVMPLFHIHGLVAGVLAPIAGRGSVTPMPFDAFGFGAAVTQIQPTWCSAVPSMWELVLTRWRDRADELRDAPWRFLRTSSSPLPARLMSELEQVFGVPVLEAYGMTEAAHQIAANPLPPGQRTPNSVGLPTGDTKIRILDPGRNGEGMIQIQGSTIIDAYLAGEAPDSFIGGWFSTGDQGRVDGDGRLFITGRISEFINRGGENISPHEIEEAIASHPDVERVAAFPLPHPVLGQVPSAAVVLRHGARVEVTELNAHVAALLSRPKRPTRLEIVDDWPLGPTGKLQRRFLAEQLGWT